MMPARSDKAAHQLIFAARHRPKRVAELVTPHVGTSDAWKVRLRTLIQWSLSPDLVDLAVILLDRGDLDDLRGPIAVNAGFFSVLYGLHQQDPAGAARVIGAYLRRNQARAAASDESDPFTSGHLPRSEVSAAEIITAVAENAYEAYLHEVLPFVVQVAEANAQPAAPGLLRASARWGIRFAGKPSGVDDALFTGAEQALRSLAHTSPDTALALVRPLGMSDIEELRFLACRTLAVAGLGDEALNWLLADDRNLELGWAGAPRAASRDLIAAATQLCGDMLLEALNTRLLNLYPPRELTVSNRHLRGRAQYDLLSAIEPSRRSTEVARRLGELQRKFAQAPPAEPQPIKVSPVGPPVPEAASLKMSDEDWLKAIARHNTDQTNWAGDTATGGADELAQLLAQRAREDPERYVQLALRFDASTSPAYFVQLIEAVASKVSTVRLSQLCQHAYGVAGHSVCRAICFAVSQAREAIDDTLATLLAESAIDPDPDREYARISSGRLGFYFGGRLLDAGLNSTRGLAARAIASVLFHGPEHSDRFLGTLASLAVDPILAVRAHTAEALRALMNHHPELALDLAEDLLTDADTDLLGARTVTALLISGLIRCPDKFAPHLRRALDSSDAVAEEAGQAWAIGYLRRELPTPLPGQVTELAAAARRGSAHVLASYPVDELPTLRELFADPNPDVRAAAATALRALPDLAPEDAEPLLRAFIDSPAVTEHFEIAISALAQSTHVLPEATIMACERAISLAGTALGDITTKHPITADNLISVLLRLYRQSDAATRSRCLDVFDQLSESHAYDLDQKLDEVR